eukprot:g3718.t2
MFKSERHCWLHFTDHRDETGTKKIWFDSLTEPPTFFPTKEDFGDPLNYIVGLEQQVGLSGLCKIKLPYGDLHQAELNDNAEYAVTERIVANPFNSHVVDDTKSFQSTERVVTLKQTQDFSKRLLRDLEIEDTEDANVMEANFWHSLSGTSTKKCDKTLFGEKIEQTFDKTCVSVLQESLQQVLDDKQNLFRRRNIDVKGSKRVYQYIALPFVTSSEGREIFSACSVNYLLEGGPRVWYSIRKSDNGKLESLYKQEMHSEGLESTKANKKSFLENEQEEVDTMSCVLDDLIQSGVELFRTIQYKGEIVLTFPSANCVWISLGWMVGESLSFAVTKWLPTIREGVTTMCSLCKPCPVPYEEILTMEAISEKL